MTDPKLLSEQELAHIADCRLEGYPDPDDDMSRVLAIRDVARLLNHIAAQDARHARDIAALKGDSIRQGEAVTGFVERVEADNAGYEARIEALESMLLWIDDHCDYMLKPGFNLLQLERRLRFIKTRIRASLNRTQTGEA